MASTLSKLVSDLNKKLGVNAIRPASQLPDLWYVPTQVPAYDYVTGGGVPVNRVIEHYGASQSSFSSLKSYLGYCAIREFQHTDWANKVPGAFVSLDYTAKKKDALSVELNELKDFTLRRGYKPVKKPKTKYCVLIDVEGTFTRDWGEHIGINCDGLIYVRPDTLENAVDIAQAFLMSEDIGLVMFDSMSVLGAEAETEKSMEENQMAANARFWNKATRKIQAAINRNPEFAATFIAINSSYDKVGLVFGNPEKVANGSQMGRTKSMSLRFTGLKEIQGDTDDGKVTIGRNISIKNMKNKTGRPYLESAFHYSYVNDGVTKANEPDVISQLVELGIRFGLIARKGTWYSYGDVRAEGMEKFKKKLSDEGAIKAMKKEVYSRFNVDKTL